MITEAAIQFNGNIYKGRMHGDIISRLPRDRDITERVEGFVTDTGIFMDRLKAYQHAAQYGQVKHDDKALASWMLSG